MPVCSVFICKNRNNKQNYKTCGITYHRYPSDPNIKEKWISAAGRSDSWFPTKSSTVCSEHFKDTDFQETKKSRRLFPWAVPTIKIRLVYKEHATFQSQPSTHSVVNPENPSMATDFQDIAVTQANTENSPRKQKFKIIIEKKNNMIKHQKLKIKRLQAATRRYKRKISAMKDKLDELKQNRDIKADHHSLLVRMLE